MAGSDLVQALGRGLDLLECVAAAESGLGLAELAAAAGLKTTTTHNLARTLAARGYLARGGSPVRYRLGPAAMALATAQEAAHLLQAARAELRSLARALPEVTWTFTEPLAGEVVLLLRAAPERPGLVEMPRRTMSPYGSASGLLFQALWGDEERRLSRARHSFVEEGAALWGSLERLEAFLDVVRRDGVCQPDLEGSEAQLIAVPVLGRGQTLLAAIGARRPPEATCPWGEVVEAARATAAALGG